MLEWQQAILMVITANRFSRRPLQALQEYQISQHPRPLLRKSDPNTVSQVNIPGITEGIASRLNYDTLRMTNLTASPLPSLSFKVPFSL